MIVIFPGDARNYRGNLRAFLPNLFYCELESAVKYPLRMESMNFILYARKSLKQVKQAPEAMHLSRSKLFLFVWVTDMHNECFRGNELTVRYGLSY